MSRQHLLRIFALRNCADDFVPKHHVNFYKFWWSQELSYLKEKAVIPDRLWKDAGRPRSGPLFSRRSSDKRAYKSAIRRQNTDSVGRYTQSCMMRCEQNMVTSFGSVGMPNLVTAHVTVNRLMAIQTTSKLLITLENILLLLVQQSKLLLFASCSRPRNRSSRPLTIDLRQILINSTFGPSHDSARLSATAIDSIDLTDFILDLYVFA